MWVKTTNIIFIYENRLDARNRTRRMAHRKQFDLSDSWIQKMYSIQYIRVRRRSKSLTRLCSKIMLLVSDKHIDYHHQQTANVLHRSTYDSQRVFNGERVYPTHLEKSPPTLPLVRLFRANSKSRIEGLLGVARP